MVKGSVLGSIFGSIIGSVLIVGLLGFFLLPTIFPAIGTNSIILQSKYGEWNSQAFLLDADTSNYIKMTDTEINFTIRQGSQIEITFSAIGLMTLDSTFDGRNSYNISLLIVGVSNRTFEIVYYDASGSTGAFRQLTYNLHINYISQPLPAGTYTIAIYWKSTWDATGFNMFGVSLPPSYVPMRTLWVHEIKNI